MDVLDDEALHKFQVRLILTEDLCSLYLKVYPILSKKYKEEANLAFLKVIRNLYVKHNVHIRGFVETVFHEALTQMIAAPNQIEEDTQNGDADDGNGAEQKPQRRFKVPIASNYFHSWIFLVNSSSQLGKIIN